MCWPVGRRPLCLELTMVEFQESVVQYHRLCSVSFTVEQLHGVGWLFLLAQWPLAAGFLVASRSGSRALLTVL